jgi:hypothetical protein
LLGSRTQGLRCLVLRRCAGDHIEWGLGKVDHHGGSRCRRRCGACRSRHRRGNYRSRCRRCCISSGLFSRIAGATPYVVMTFRMRVFSFLLSHSLDQKLSAKVRRRPRVGPSGDSSLHRSWPHYWYTPVHWISRCSISFNGHTSPANRHTPSAFMPLFRGFLSAG